MNKGILTHPRENDSTVFKLVVWYDIKLSGSYFTQIEKDQQKNRKYHDSIDYYLIGSNYVTRHDIALNKLLNHLEKWKYNIGTGTAWLFYNDFANEQQHKIGVFNQNTVNFVQPLFNLKDSVKYTEKIEYDQKTGGPINYIEKEIKTQNVFCTGLLKAPLQTYSLKNNKTTVFYKENNIKTPKII